MTNSKLKNNKKEKIPSAVDDCADITSRYERYKKENKKSQFPPIKYEKPPHFQLRIFNKSRQ